MPPGPYSQSQHNPSIVYLTNADSLLKFSKDFTVGAFSAVLAKTLCSPFERVKLILQLQNAQPTITRPYSGLIDCLLRVPKEQGFLSFWRGNGTNCLRASSQVKFYKRIF